jgi:hypothetical protein
MLNVVIGDMSLVGPRPQVPRYVDMFEPNLRELVLSVRPGVTGITALAFRNEEEMLASQNDREGYYIEKLLPVKLNMDAWYVQNRSLVSDLYLLNKTASLLISQRVISKIKSSSSLTDEQITQKVVDGFCKFVKSDNLQGQKQPVLHFRLSDHASEQSEIEPQMSHLHNDELRPELALNTK